ncbi:helix-turn-helix transcriptional regulator [Bacillus sp. APMAM]|nr:helix-turn-helix transcriptional regulator [Bacillus sp. APMAM]RTZ53594.1 XRE family transcriptional regulator [Bacillus sp. SAJ1]
MNEKERYFLLRRHKKISMKMIAEYIGCSQSLISKYETNKSLMSDYKIQLYKKFIDTYEK